MNFRTLRRSLGSFLAITRGRLRSKTYAPHPRRDIFIETSARCNLACRFCAYADRGPGDFMEQNLFEASVEQAVAMGFRSVWLTPMLGDVFTDPDWPDRFSHLEAHRGVERFGFYTNFIMPRRDAISALPRFGKLDSILISLYGHDRDSFERVTRKPGAQFERLIGNLEVLLEAAPPSAFAGGIHFNIRTIDGLKRNGIPDTPLMRLVARFEKELGAQILVADEFDTWGGTISRAQVAPIGVTLTDGRPIYKHGACRFLFSGPQVRADGTVHACACRDVDGSLRLGSLPDTALADVLSLANPRLKAIIDEQQQGRFNANCQSCSMYRSIHDDRPSREDAEIDVLPLNDALAMMKGSRS